MKKFVILFCLLIIPSFLASPGLTYDIEKDINNFIKKERKELIKHVLGDYKEEIVSAIIKHVRREECLHGEINLRKLLIIMANKESSGNPEAISKKGAVGVWQIMKKEAERYGYTSSDMFLIENNLIVAKKVLYRKACLVKNPWNAVKYYNGRGPRAHNYKISIKKAYYKIIQTEKI